MESVDAFLTLVRLGIGNNASKLPQKVDWSVIKALAEKQGLSAIIIDGIEHLPEALRPPQIYLIEWIGEVFQAYEIRYEMYSKAIAELAGFYNHHDLKMMILKGYACSLNWPNPNHRPCGDIDIWQFGEYRKADDLLTKEKGIKVDNSHHHHTVFYWHDYMVENHYDFINVHHHKSNVELEKVFKELGQDDTHFAEIDGEKVYLPSPNLHALFLLKHMMNDFTSFSVTLRQLLDWAFHIQKYKSEIDWDWLLGIVDKYHIIDFYNSINAICVEDLGFSSSIFPRVQFSPEQKAKVLADILNPKYSVEEPKHLVPRLFYKYRRWQGNAWKHDMCYNESRWSAFCTGIWAKLLKPASF